MPPFRERKIILASSSPRRKQILEMMKIDFEVVKPTIGEEYPFQLQTSKVPAYLAQAKARNIYEITKTDKIILAADTLVFYKDRIIGKPQHREEAIEILQRLSGNVHNVITGVALYCNEKCVHFHEETSVEFYKLSDDDIVYYIDNYRPFDKAGAYSISEWLGLYAIKRIEGDYYNVLGLPISRTLRELSTFIQSI